MKLRSAFQKTGLLPRSINQTLEKFRRSLDPKGESEILEEFQASRTRTIISLRYLLLLLIVPLLINQISKNFVIEPLVKNVWLNQHLEVFVNSTQEERLLAELRNFQAQIRFESLLKESPAFSEQKMQEKVQDKAIALSEKYTDESISAISNIFADTLAAIAFITLTIKGKEQLSALKQFIDELIYGLSDSAKAFFLILITDMFVGFHSSYGWEILLKATSHHFGLPESKQSISLFIATAPVILDAIGKYWIFRYLNRISPSSVATYRNMKE